MRIVVAEQPVSAIASYESQAQVSGSWLVVLRLLDFSQLWTR
jgi:hypothetical protein